MKHKKSPKNYCKSFKHENNSRLEVSMHAIGMVHSPYKERFSAPKQSTECKSVQGSIELNTGHDFEQALQDLDGFSHIWVIYFMHLNQGWNPTVKPPRDTNTRRGLFSTRAPHRPNPLGLSVVRLINIKKRILLIEGLDMLDGTPVLDIKPYIAYADSIEKPKQGWLEPFLGKD